MAIGITGEHEELAAAVRGWAERNVSAADEGTETATEAERPRFWGGLADLGLPGLHLAEEHGGQGGGLLELAVAVAELGRSLVPGPFLPTVFASAVIDRCRNEKARDTLLAGLADGSRTAAVALGAACPPPRTREHPQSGSKSAAPPSRSSAEHWPTSSSCR